MKFLFMIYHDERVLEALPEQEMQALVDSALDYDEEIRRSGHYIVSNALQPARTARTLRVREGKVLVTDGPFAETREQLGGFFLVEARDLDEACEVASRFPPARLGTIEVRLYCVQLIRGVYGAGHLLFEEVNTPGSSTYAPMLDWSDPDRVTFTTRRPADNPRGADLFRVTMRVR